LSHKKTFTLFEEDIIGLRKTGRIVASILKEMIDQIRPGITTYHLDQLARKYLKQLDARSAPLMAGFPGNTCISVNEIIAHGVPNRRKLQYGDRINIDVSAEHGGYFSDIASTVILGQGGVESSPLLDCAREITQRAAEMSVAGTPINKITKIIESLARQNNFTVVKNLCSHGVGTSLHSYPENIINYYDPEETLVLEEGMVIAWEPYISTCAVRAIESADEWNLTTHNQSDVAQFEHTVRVTKEAPEILTVLD
jgi:methionyl aminopeptidase